MAEERHRSMALAKTLLWATYSAPEINEAEEELYAKGYVRVCDEDNHGFDCVILVDKKARLAEAI